jgi:hypothetical protein
MSPLFPVFLILSGVFLEEVYRKIKRWLKVPDDGEAIVISPPRHMSTKQQHDLSQTNYANPEHGTDDHTQVGGDTEKIGNFILRALAVVVYVLLVYQIVRGNFNSLNKMAEAPEVHNTYTSDDFSVCDYIGTVATPGQHAYIYSPEGVKYCALALPGAWYYGNKNLRVQHLVEGFITPDQLVSGDLVVMVSSNRGLNDKELSQLIDLGFKTNSLNSLQFGRDLAGKITAASICFRCGY